MYPLQLVHPSLGKIEALSAKAEAHLALELLL